MLLKRLELQGFKSFADKISLDLTYGITAIVGPNGSGKSNITDAIRWLLGEREARHLRGGRAEDLIFAGTKDRPRAGLAQAALYFDNSSGFFPVDYKEVVISRRIARDGESQIFLNKSAIRLKDVIDFFAKSKIGARGLGIINQGESDIFINAAPFERREMIEEILGLKEYQIRKAEASRRLKNTFINLAQARALVAELTPHLKTLKRQVAKYEDKEKLMAELRSLEDSYYGSRLAFWQGALAKVEPLLKEIDEALTEEEKEISKLTAELNQVRSAEPLSGEQIREAQIRRNKLLEERFALEKSLSRLEAKMELAANTDLAKTDLLDAVSEIRKVAADSLSKAEPSQLQEALRKIIALIDRLLDKNRLGGENFESARRKLAEELARLDRELVKLDEEEAELTKSIRNFNSQFREIFTAFEEKKNNLLKLKERKQALIFERAKAAEKIEDLVREVTEAGRKISEFENWQGSPPSDEENVLRRIFRLRGELAAIGEIDPRIIEEYRATEERYNFLVSQINDLEKAVADLEKLIKQLDDKIRHEFTSAIEKINQEFTRYIQILFGGGRAKLVVEEEKLERENGEVKQSDSADNSNDREEPAGGVYVEVSLPRKKVKGLEVLSGGEKALVSIAALFALISVSAPPFLVLDEIDAALDERNARRFGELLREFSAKTQFIVVTHNRATMETADVLYGVTMSPDGTSKVLSLKLTT